MVRPVLRQRIEKAIAELGYVPDGNARALVQRRTMTIGAIVPTIDNAIFSTLLRGLQTKLQENKYTLLLASSNYSLEQEAEEVRTLLIRGVDGILLVGNQRAPAVYDLLEASAKPYVNTYAFDDRLDHPSVGFNNWKAGEAVVDHLVPLGHERIVIIAGITTDNDRARARVQGIKAGLARHGLPFNAEQYLECPYTLEAGRSALRTLMKRQPQPTAIICGNDILACGAIFQCQRSNIKIPEDLSIAGIDGLSIGGHVTPSLTTMSVPFYEMGELAAVSLLNRLNANGKASEKVELEATLLIRESTAPPRD
jgi:LacI family transcriptional regulator